MYDKIVFTDGDLLEASHLNNIQDNIFEVAGQLADAGAVKEGNYYEVLMKDATFIYEYDSASWARGHIDGYSLLDNNHDGESYLFYYDNGVNKYEVEAIGAMRQINIMDKSFTGSTTYGHLIVDSSIKYTLTVPKSIYDERNGEIKITILHKVQEEKILVKEDLTPVTKPLILDSSVDYSVLPFKGDEALQAILDGRQILVKVPNASGGNLYANYMPVFQYQLPDQNNNYLSLLYLKDDLGKNLVTVLGTLQPNVMPDFSIVYGQLDLKLSKTYSETPLK